MIGINNSKFHKRIVLSDDDDAINLDAGDIIRVVIELVCPSKVR